MFEAAHSITVRCRIAWDWRLSASSMLLCALAFNLTFFVQEFFLVVPKALTPGLHPTLFHNNHTWMGHNPVADLLQGTGALADVASGLVFAVLLRGSAARPVTLRLFLFWMAYQGFFLALPQVVIGAMNPANDVGMALEYLRLSARGKQAAALVAVLLMGAIGFRLVRQFIRLVGTATETATGAARAWFIFRVATLPAFASVLLILPFREPRNLTEVLLVPLIVMISGLLWIQGCAFLARPATQTSRGAPSVVIPLGALVILLALFQFVLRPGIRFY